MKREMQYSNLRESRQENWNQTDKLSDSFEESPKFLSKRKIFNF